MFLFKIEEEKQEGLATIQSLMIISQYWKLKNIQNIFQIITKCL